MAREHLVYLLCPLASRQPKTRLLSALCTSLELVNVLMVLFKLRGRCAMLEVVSLENGVSDLLGSGSLLVTLCTLVVSAMVTARQGPYAGLGS